MSPIQHFSVNRPCPGERVSGDAAFLRPVQGGWFAAVVDVLGHGPEAHELAEEIVAWLERNAQGNVVHTMERLHERLKGTRGAAAGLCFITESGKLEYVGTGNPTIRRFGSAETRLVARDGVVGHQMRTPHLQDLELEPGDLVLLYSDGVSDRFRLQDYPAIVRHDPPVVARSVVRRFGKDHDDATCMALRYTG